MGPRNRRQSAAEGPLVLVLVWSPCSPVCSGASFDSASMGRCSCHHKFADGHDEFADGHEKCGGGHEMVAIAGGFDGWKNN